MKGENKCCISIMQAQLFVRPCKNIQTKKVKRPVNLMYGSVLDTDTNFEMKSASINFVGL